MYGAELRTYGLGAVVSMLLGAGIGFGWYYFVDSNGGKAAASATPLAQQDAPKEPLQKPSGQ
jgi:predicted negative regulator of RcsB-dependent stress response